MTLTDANEKPRTTIAKLPFAAAIVALLGLADAIYLTIHHYTAEAVPCGLEFDCGAVLNSSYAEIAGVPLAAFGAAAYFAAFSLALLTAFGNRITWNLFGIQATMMAVVSGYLIYVQYAFINAWCQYCLISAGISFTLFLLFWVSALLKTRKAV
ncbi:MAG: vitamin K epoxide reductase family protein [Chloracidobacterium sp.]|nr:vitamin K epoxide reductase family protein [Chloracidobacterium sp.]